MDESNYREQDAVFEEALELLGEDVAVIHLKDYVVEQEGLRAVAAGEGQMDYRSILAFVERQKPYIQATLENTTPDNAVFARMFIEEQIKNH